MSVVESIRCALRLLIPRDRALLGLAIAIQMATAFLDLLGVLLIGLVGAMAVSVIQSQPIPPVIDSYVDRIGLGDLTSESLVVVLSAAAAFVLLTKSILSSYLIRRVLRFLANRQALVSSSLVAEFMSRSLALVTSRSSQESAFALTTGVAAATVGILGQLVIIATESALMVVLGVALLALDPLVTLVSVAFFGLVSLVMYRFMGSRAARYGALGAATDIASLDVIQDAISGFREVFVSGRRDFFVQRISDLRWQSAEVSAGSAFLGQVPKYVFEAAMVLGGLALGGFLFSTRDAVAAVGLLAVFITAASRVMPSLLRLQGAALGIRTMAGAAEPAFAMVDDLKYDPAVARRERPKEEVPRDPGLENLSCDFGAEITVARVDFRYQGSKDLTLSDVTFSIPVGSRVAIIGPSGAGKSTLADILLGIQEPSSGQVLISGMAPGEMIEAFPGSISYVPQRVTLMNSSIRDNVCFGLPASHMDDDLVWSALVKAQADDFVRSLPAGLDSQVGEGGTKFSGGQKQRIGLARALYSEPALLVLDEATSALDAETEAGVTQALSRLRGSTTVVAIAHRLSTVRDSDLVVYLEGGAVLASGTFDDVRRRVPSFDRQAGLMGL